MPSVLQSFATTQKGQPDPSGFFEDLALIDRMNFVDMYSFFKHRKYEGPVAGRHSAFLMTAAVDLKLMGDLGANWRKNAKSLREIYGLLQFCDEEDEKYSRPKPAVNFRLHRLFDKILPAPVKVNRK